MNRDHIPSISDPTSPWYTLSEMRKPNIKWCEGQNNGWIIEPANTWSNLIYVILGIIALRKVRSNRSGAIRAYPVILIALGLCSGVYHASYTFLLQVLDFFGMYLITYLMMMINLKRAKRVKNTLRKTFWGLVLGTTVLTVLCDFYTNFPIQLIILFQVVILLIQEIILWKKRTRDFSMKHFYVGFCLLLIAALFSSLDVTRRLCDPEDHLIQGHALWHTFSALAIFCFFFHHRQFDEELR